MTDQSKHDQMLTLVERLKAFADGCRGSMWQSRDETITLLDQSADALTAALDEIERLRGDLESIADAFGCECGDQAREALKGDNQ